MTKVAVLLLAAGASRRMEGRDKLLEDVGGQPLLRYTARHAVSAAGQVFVMLPPDCPKRRATLQGLPVQLVVVPDCATGMAAAVRAGMAAIAQDCEAVIVALADMPDITADTYSRLIAAHNRANGGDICRAVTQSGRPGHPVLFDRHFFPALAQVRGDRGGREVVRANPQAVIDVPTLGEGATRDLDTPEDWKNWRRIDG